MNIIEFMPEGWVPAFVFFARIADVSIGTLRIMFVSKGLRIPAAILGFIEVLIWIIVVSQIFLNLDNWMNYVAFAGGFAAGNYVGMLIEEKLKIGIQIFRIIIKDNADSLINKLRDADFRVTELDAKGSTGKVKILFTVCKRKRWKELISIIREENPEAFYSVEDVKYTNTYFKQMPASGDILEKMLKLKKGL